MISGLSHDLGAGSVVEEPLNKRHRPELVTPENVIIFSDEYMEKVQTPHHDPVVVS